jgi:hypothetical protein
LQRNRVCEAATGYYKLTVSLLKLAASGH